MKEMISKSTLHYQILKFIVENGYAPEIEYLSARLNASKETVIEVLYDLQEYHGVVLHPDKPKVWVIHPFSLAPTNFTVKSKRGTWWGNCAWCSLGVAALLDEDMTITTTIGAEGERVDIEIRNGEIVQKDLLIHFPISMKNAWDNVIYTCSTMLVFRDISQVAAWSQRHNIPVGDVQPIVKIWEFSKKWYGNHLDPNWQKWTNKEAKALFDKYGLSHPIWKVDVSASRF